MISTRPKQAEFEDEVEKQKFRRPVTFKVIYAVNESNVQPKSHILNSTRSVWERRESEKGELKHLGPVHTY